MNVDSIVELIKANEFPLITGLSGGLILIYVMLTPKMTDTAPSFSNQWDHHHYITMAQNPFVLFCPATPECYRPLLPWLIGVLPTPLQSTWIAVTAGGFVVSGVALYAFLLELDLSPGWGLVGVAMLYHLSGFTRFLMFDFWLLDTIGIALILIGLWAIITDRSKLLIAIVIPGVLIREPIIFLVPTWYLWEARTSGYFNKQLITRVIVTGVITAILLLLPRLVVSSGYSITDQWARFGLFARLDGPSNQLERITIYTWGILIFLPIFDLRTVLEKCWPFAPLVVFGFLQIFIGGSVERYQMVFAPVMIYAALLGFKRIHDNIGRILPETPTPHFYAVPFAVIALLQSVGGRRKFGLAFDIQFTIVVVCVVGAL